MSEVKLNNKRPNPLKYDSLIEYLQDTGQLHKVTSAQLGKARHLFVTKQLNTSRVARMLKLPLAVIERWVVSFGWEEERDRRMFETWRKLNKGFRERQSAGLDERHNRIFGQIESVAEQLLQDHQNSYDDPAFEDKRLSAADLKSLTMSVHAAMECRRTIHNKRAPTSTVKVIHEAPELFDSIARAVVGATQEQLLPAPRRMLEVTPLAPASDSELETVVDDGASEDSRIGQR